MRRREFIAALGCAVTASAIGSLTALAQPPKPMRRVGVLMSQVAADPGFRAFVEGLQQLGWREGGNLAIDTRFAAGDADVRRKSALELVALAPEVIMAGGSGATESVRQATRVVPIVFVQVGDPVAAGFVKSLARPGGNATGFTQFEYSVTGKWLELLKQIVPGIARAAVLRDPGVPTGIAQFGAMQAFALTLGVDLVPIDVRDAREIELAVTSFAGFANGGLIVTGSALALVHRDLIIELAVRHRLPTVYSDPVFVNTGGLMSYGPDRRDQYRRAAGYVDRILKGEMPADLPVQNPTKYELVINLKTAKALGLILSNTLLARADEVIE